MLSTAVISKSWCCYTYLISFYDFQTSLIANILIRMSRCRSDSNTCNSTDLQEEKFTQDAMARLHPVHSLANFFQHKYWYIILQLVLRLQNRHIQGLLICCRTFVWTKSEEPIKHLPLSVAQLEISLERLLMIVIKLIRLHLLFTGSKYISGTLHLTC